MLDATCRIITEIGEYCVAWVGYAENDQEKVVKLAAKAGCEEGVIEALPANCFSWADDAPRYCLSSTAIRTGQLAVVNNITEASELDVPWREQAINMGYTSMLALPLDLGANLRGVLNIYSAETGVFQDQDLELLKELSGDLAFGIRTLRERTAYRKETEKFQSTLVQTIQAIALTLEKRDPYTAGHQQRVAQLAAAIASEMGLDAERVKGIRLGGLIHDIGKIYVPVDILVRPGHLSDAEFAIIKSHPQVGFDIIREIDFPWPVQNMVLQHHERLDGSGYPDGLKGEDIILEAKIMTVADVVEAMSSHRPYRPGRGIDAALDEIRNNSGRLYDADIVACCVRLFTEKGFCFG